MANDTAGTWHMKTPSGWAALPPRPNHADLGYAQNVARDLIRYVSRCNTVEDLAWESRMAFSMLASLAQPGHDLNVSYAVWAFNGAMAARLLEIRDIERTRSEALRWGIERNRVRRAAGLPA